VANVWRWVTEQGGVGRPECSRVASHEPRCVDVTIDVAIALCVKAGKLQSACRTREELWVGWAMRRLVRWLASYLSPKPRVARKSKVEGRLDQLGKEKVKAPFNRHECEETVHRY
jgi:hypothetical protein